ncbi:MAG: Glu-tRNA(Gln) amidotransferase subunit GatD [Nitrososphaerales archaeon]|nr:Glu-tRNA(Gln) amidotransferase subunit GatD [Nitrososphaerales archaeon]
MEELAGYRGSALSFLRKARTKVGDILELSAEWGKVTGALVPRYEYDDDSHVVLKLPSGYNVGLEVSKLKSARVKAKGEKPSFKPPPAPRSRARLPRVLILGTGGTIASRVDYRTGAVRPAVSAGELYALIPELSEIAKVEPEILFSIYSENMEPSHWSKLARRVARAVGEGFAGVVITLGTDTLGYTAAALSFALVGVPIPVVLTAAQRSSDRPSSDAATNLIGAVSVAARAVFSGVYVAMHMNDSDSEIAIHRGTRVRKNHTSARAAFESVGTPLAGVWRDGAVQNADDSLPPRGKRTPFKPRLRFEGRVALLKFYPSMPKLLIDTLRRAGIRAIVLEGSGLGHVNSRNIAAVRSCVSKGRLVFMTSQCVRGRVDMRVYETGRDLLAAGAIPLEDMLAETALVKAMWALGNSKNAAEARQMMTRNLAGEMTLRTLPK